MLFRSRLASGDAGVGLNVRRMRERFLGKMTVTYSLRPLPWCNGSLFKAYPGAWKLFLEDPEEPGRFNLVDEYAQRPAGEELDDELWHRTVRWKLEEVKPRAAKAVADLRVAVE